MLANRSADLEAKDKCIYTLRAAAKRYEKVVSLLLDGDADVKKY